jgi:LacI family transcriptional regulator
LPLLAIGRHPLDAPSVRIDNVGAGRAATVHLIERGRRRIAFVSGLATQTTVADRRQGYRQALQAAGLLTDQQLEVETDPSPPGGEQAVARLLKLPRPPDAVFAFNDNLAVGVMHALARAGRRVPDDVAVIGFDDTPLAPYFVPSLSSVAVPAYELGANAAGRLLRLLAGQQIEPTLWLETHVVERSSTQTGITIASDSF